ncbi:hypothetical protein KJS94_09055 [Flavihumibacter rivuli]|uniref:hypothetical protein n=1 Tax=Flavihumibacter rivuli TaxID=2838156 RepID=UPI001EFB3763|nr:hypothetical protein [Flavihumibacter rivuli]ULQ58342.1 hypothetical protein KJS94_09055 [Flavihumibacter rivuli]
MPRTPSSYVLGVAGALMTTFYMFRLYAMTFQGKFRGTHEQEHHLHESPSAMTIPLMVLAALSVVGGFVGIPEVFKADAHWLEHFLAPVFAASTAKQEAHHIAHSTEYLMMGGVTALVLAVIAFAWSKFSKYEKTDAETTGLARVLENKWYVDELYDAIIGRPINALGQLLEKVEKYGVDFLVNGVGRSVQYASRQIRLLQSGQVGSYILMMVIGMLILFALKVFLKN